MHRALLFKLGIIPLILILWGWRDSIRCYTYASCEAAGYHLTGYHAYSRFYIEFYSGAFNGLPGNFQFYRKKDFDGNSPFGGPSILFPSPDFRHEVPDIPFEQLSEEDSFRAENGERSGSITIPYWIISLIYVVLGFILFRLAARRRKPSPETSEQTDSPHGKISP